MCAFARKSTLFLCIHVHVLYVCLVVRVVPNEVSQRQTDVSQAAGRLRISRGIYSHQPWGEVGIS